MQNDPYQPNPPRPLGDLGTENDLALALCGFMVGSVYRDCFRQQDRSPLHTVFGALKYDIVNDDFWGLYEKLGQHLPGMMAMIIGLCHNVFSKEEVLRIARSEELVDPTPFLEKVSRELPEFAHLAKMDAKVLRSIIQNGIDTLVADIVGQDGPAGVM